MCMARLFPDNLVKKQKTLQNTKLKIRAITKTKRSNINNNKSKRMHGTCMARLFPDRMIPSSWDGWMGTPWGGEKVRNSSNFARKEKIATS